MLRVTDRINKRKLEVRKEERNTEGKSTNLTPSLVTQIWGLVREVFNPVQPQHLNPLARDMLGWQKLYTLVLCTFDAGRREGHVQNNGSQTDDTSPWLHHTMCTQPDH